MTALEIQTRIRKLADRDKAVFLLRFFKTAPGQYGHGDKFLGINVPVLRKCVKDCGDVAPGEAVKLLASEMHEERLAALLILARTFDIAKTDAEKTRIYRIYLQNVRHINNWDLVDVSAPYIVGEYLADKSRKPLYVLARSRNLWKRRIAIISTLTFIRRNDFDETLAIAEILLNDDHDLIHKAVGWMLREVGKRDIRKERQFLNRHCKTMPRTMLRYAIERFPEQIRKKYLSRKV